MPRYRIHITTSDGSLDSRDPEGVPLDGIGAVRALVIETLVEASREPPAPGATRVITVTAEDERGGVAYRDWIALRGRAAPSTDDKVLWRAMAAMHRNA